MSRIKDKVNESSVLGQSNQWFDKYVSICQTSGTDHNYLYLDVLKDLCNDNISDNIVIHLLSIIETLVPLFRDNDEVEQTVGSLINIYSSTTKSDRIRQKYLYTTTSILTYHYEMAENNDSLKQLFDSVIQLLIKNRKNGKTVIGFASVECLREIGTATPKLLQNVYENEKIKTDESLILSSLLHKNSFTVNDEDIKNIIQKLPDLQGFELFFVLTQLFDTIRSKHYQHIISPMIFKPFLSQLIMSCEVHNFHFALQLLLSFGLELFSTLEEQKLLKQLTIVATHPSLSIALRLLALDYTKSIFSILKPTSIDPSSVAIIPFDGPDTQEKKLNILNETSIDNQNLLNSLKPLKSLSLRNNIRATNSFYRVLYCITAKRCDIKNQIQDLLISLIFSCPEPHIRKCISLLNCQKDLSKGTIRKLVENLVKLSETEIFKSLTELNAFIFAFEWIFKQKDLELNENEIVFLLNLIRKHCKRWLQTSSQALNCCTAVLHYQNISEQIKDCLLSILEWLVNERKNDLSITSLAQIYILALNTLKDDQNIKQVFNSEDETDFDIEITKNCTEVPLDIKRIDGNSKEMIDISENDFKLNLYFQINISDKFKHFDRIYALVLFFNSLDGNIHEEYEIPILNRNETKIVKIELNSRISKPFTFRISANFNDSNGTVYFSNFVKEEHILLKDILLPVSLGQTDFDQLSESIMRDKDSMQTILCIRQFKDIESFVLRFKWISLLMIANTNNFVCGATPDRLVLGKVKVVNQFVNLFVITNNYQLLPSLYYEFIVLPKK